ncbi:hypothetical protein ACFL6I_26820, partial [candidate division KSB1 bacterium]
NIKIYKAYGFQVRYRIFAIIKRKMVPSIIPKKIWLNATEEKRAPSLAKSPSEAEVKIKKPKTTSVPVIIRSERSMDFILG